MIKMTDEMRDLDRQRSGQWYAVYSGDGDQDWGAAYELSGQHDGL